MSHCYIFLRYHNTYIDIKDVSLKQNHATSASRPVLVKTRYLEGINMALINRDLIIANIKGV
jgi:hypothetical protein